MRSFDFFRLVSLILPAPLTGHCRFRIPINDPHLYVLLLREGPYDWAPATDTAGRMRLPKVSGGFRRCSLTTSVITCTTKVTAHKEFRVSVVILMTLGYIAIGN